MASIYQYWTPEMQNEIALHNWGWSPSIYDFHNYLERSLSRYYLAYKIITQNSNLQSVCDIGGFWGVFPVTLQELGFKVTMTETLKYYSDSFQALFSHIEKKGVTIVDYDPFQPVMPLPGRYDLATLMAVIEHYPHSLKILFQNVKAMLKPNGKLYIEVPNIAYWPKRVSFLLGQTPLTPIEQIYQSKEPFIGHHHEFTISELRKLANLVGLSIEKESFYNYSDPFHLRSVLKYPLKSLNQWIAFALLPSSRECISVLCSLVTKEL